MNLAASQNRNGSADPGRDRGHSEGAAADVADANCANKETSPAEASGVREALISGLGQRRLRWPVA